MKQFITLLIIAAFLMFNSCCQPPADKLAFLNDYKPGNEYLKPGMIDLHFIMETSSISKVDSVFKKLIERNDLPLTPKDEEKRNHAGLCLSYHGSTIIKLAKFARSRCPCRRHLFALPFSLCDHFGIDQGGDGGVRVCL